MYFKEQLVYTHNLNGIPTANFDKKKSFITPKDLKNVLIQNWLFIII